MRFGLFFSACMFAIAMTVAAVFLIDDWYDVIRLIVIGAGTVWFCWLFEEL